MPAAIAGLSRRRLAGLALMLPAARAVAAETVLRGTVVFRERMALPPDAVTEVTLADVSLADAPARTIAETRVSGRRIPAPWTLRFDSRRIDPRHSYALQAENAADVAATALYGAPITAAVQRDTMLGVQFHPEKSQSYGLSLLARWLAWKP